MIYLDTGCFVKLYYPERDSHLVVARVAGQPICYTPLHELKFTNALQQKVFHAGASQAQVLAAMSLVTTDLATGILIRPALPLDTMFADASALATNHTATIGCRSLDILHCSAAQALNVLDFVTTDAKQKRLAVAIGLPFTEL